MPGVSDGGRAILITGASSGIGVAAARLFAGRGDRVLLSARRGDRLEALAGELGGVDAGVMVETADLAHPAAAEELAARAVERLGRVDVLVNNAGFGAQRRFTACDRELMERMLNVNLVSAMLLARAVAVGMVERGSGSIINVASVGGLVAHPLNVVYCASKHALVGFSRSLRLELKGTGVAVVAVCPGATRTEFFDVARGEIPFDDMIERFAAPPEKVAASIVRAAGSGRGVSFPTLSAWFLAWADKWLPWLSQAGNLRYRDQVLRLEGRDHKK